MIDKRRLTVHTRKKQRPHGRALRLFVYGVASVAITGLLLACGQSQGPKTITETRTVQKPQSALPPGHPPTDSSNGLASPHGMPEAGVLAEDFKWLAPPGWQAASPTSMRLANFKIPGNPEAECYLTVLTGKAGGARANADRWRQQMSLPPYTDAEFAALPKVKLLGQDAALVELAGKFSGMDNKEPSETAQGLLGAILCTDQEGIFVKMIGPEDVVGREKDNFIAFCQSVSRGE